MSRPALAEYQRKRDFSRTAEPPGRATPSGEGPLRFVVQKHAARQLHYDFRLEVDGVLKSWPIPKGPSLDPKTRRLAVMTEDHPLDYATFEGVIPKGEYGGGEVIVWDAGTYGPVVNGAPCFDRAEAEALARRGVEEGKLSFVLHGRKLRGEWTLVRREGKQWLFLKKDDASADPARDILAEDWSTLSGLTIADLKQGLLPGRRESLLLRPSDMPGARRKAMPSSLAPMLPSLAEQPFSNPDWLFEPKLDGYRIIAIVRDRSVRLISRRGLDVTAQFPRLSEPLAKQPHADLVLDGEIVALNERGAPSFQHLQDRGRDPGLELIYYVFDLLYLDGYDLQAVPLEQRKALLETHVVSSDGVRLVDYVAGDGKALYEAALENGLEGVIGKRRDSRYEVGRRSSAWLKVKSAQTDDFVIGGYTTGTGARAGTFGALLLGSPDPSTGRLVYSGHVGTGFNQRILRDLLGRLEPLRTDHSPFGETIPTTGRWARKPSGPITWVKPELVAEVKFGQRTRDGILRFPVFVRLRDDKSPAEVDAREIAATVPAPVAPERPGANLDELLEQLRQPGAAMKVNVEGHDIALTNLDKALWPKQGRRPALSKRDLLIYLARVSPWLLGHLKDRPLSLSRYPNGIGGTHFFQKHWHHPLPPYVESVRIYSDHNKQDGEYMLCNNLPTLIWLGQVANLELHTWYSRINPEPDGLHLLRTFDGSLERIDASLLNYPDFVVFDLDPYLYSGKEAAGDEPELHRRGFARTCKVARLLKDLLEELSLVPFVKTTGKTGLHIYVPIVRRLDYHSVHAFAKTIAEYLMGAHPRDVTASWAVEKRRGKVFVDYNQNVKGKTLASIYSPRPLAEAAVSMPLRWDELDDIYPTDFTILTAPERLEATGDLWAGLLDAKRDLGALVETAAS